MNVPFLTQITLKNYSTVKCFNTMQEIFVFHYKGRVILCLIRQKGLTVSHSQVLSCVIRQMGFTICSHCKASIKPRDNNYIMHCFLNAWNFCNNRSTLSAQWKTILCNSISFDDFAKDCYNAIELAEIIITLLLKVPSMERVNIKMLNYLELMKNILK